MIINHFFVPAWSGSELWPTPNQFEVFNVNHLDLNLFIASLSAINLWYKLCCIACVERRPENAMQS